MGCEAGLLNPMPVGHTRTISAFLKAFFLAKKKKRKRQLTVINPVPSAVSFPAVGPPQAWVRAGLRRCLGRVLSGASLEQLRLSPAGCGAEQWGR